MLHWMAERYDVRGTVVIIRHPCAVIASRLQMGENWSGSVEKKKEVPVSRRFGGEIPNSICDEFAHVFEETKLWVEHLAIDWALDYYFAFHEHPRGRGDYPWVLTSYERLLTEGEDELKRIISALGAEVPREMRSQIGEASSFAAENFRPDIHHQLTKWQSVLTERQVRAILDVTKAFRLDFYTEEPIPNFERLFQFQDSTVAHPLQR